MAAPRIHTTAAGEGLSDTLGRADLGLLGRADLGLMDDADDINLLDGFTASSMAVGKSVSDALARLASRVCGRRHRCAWQADIVDLADQNESRKAVQTFLNSDDPHPKIQQFKREPLRSEAISFVSGTDMFELDLLPEVAAKARFAWTGERPIEEKHHRVRHFGAIAPNHKEHFQDYMMKKGEIMDTLKSDATFLHRLAD